MWHGKSPISKASGYSQGRVVRRGGQDSSIRMTNKAEAGMGAISILGFIVFIALFLTFVGAI
jgi:hypothetical protein